MVRTRSIRVPNQTPYKAQRELQLHGLFWAQPESAAAVLARSFLIISARRGRAVPSKPCRNDPEQPRVCSQRERPRSCYSFLELKHPSGNEWRHSEGTMNDLILVGLQILFNGCPVGHAHHSPLLAEACFKNLQVTLEEEQGFAEQLGNPLTQAGLLQTLESVRLLYP